MVRRWCTVVVALALALAAAGCATTVVGNAVRDPGVDPLAANPALLNPGNYPTTPRPPLGLAGDQGGLVESRRMGENVVLPFEVDPSLTHPEMRQGVVPNAPEVRKSFPDPVSFAVFNKKMLAGFATVGKNEFLYATKGVTHMVLRFATAEDAAGVATDMATGSAVVTYPMTDTPITTRPLPMPGNPGTAAVTYDSDFNGHVVLAYTAHGPYVFAQFAWSKDNTDTAAGIVAGIVTRQGPLIDQFQATPPDQLAALLLDPDGVVARMLTTPPDETPINNGPYGPRAALAFMNNAGSAAKLFAEVGLTAFVRQKTRIYVTRDAAAARRAAGDFAAEIMDPGAPMKFLAADGITGLPSAQCFSTPDDSPPGKAFTSPTNWSYCLATVDRYIVEAEAGQLPDLKQIVSAQYLMLTAK